MQVIRVQHSTLSSVHTAIHTVMPTCRPTPHRPCKPWSPLQDRISFAYEPSSSSTSCSAPLITRYISINTQALCCVPQALQALELPSITKQVS
jgi:hypothetical protein